LGSFLLIDSSYFWHWLAFFGFITVRYFVVVGSVHLLFYTNFGRRYLSWPSAKKPNSPPVKSIYRDIELSLVSGVIFAFCGAMILEGSNLGITLIYSDLHQYGLWYNLLSFVLVLLLQDTYFYFTHRYLHKPKLFKLFHRGHHRSIQPTPWTSFAFDPPEALLQALFLVVIVCIVPLHYLVFMMILLTMTIWSIVNHLGFELFQNPLKFNWFIGAKHHLIHHQKYNMHYGLYFTFWDRLLGTQDIDYDK